MRQRRFLPFASPYTSPFVSKICTNGVAKLLQVVVPQKRRKISQSVMFAAFLRHVKRAKNEKITKSVDHVVGNNSPLGFYKYEPCLQCSQISAGFGEFLCTHECYCIRYLPIYSAYCARMSNKFKKQKWQWAIRVKIISCVVTNTHSFWTYLMLCSLPPDV